MLENKNIIKLNDLELKIAEKLKVGFNVEMLAEAFNCSVGRINELKCEPIENVIYHKADINAIALLSFAKKHEIDLTKIDFDKIIAARKQPKIAKSSLLVGDTTKYGIIEQINKIGQSFVYLIKTPENTYVVKSTKDLAE